jgi:hypothetical protein
MESNLSLLAPLQIILRLQIVFRRTTQLRIVPRLQILLLLRTVALLQILLLQILPLKMGLLLMNADPFLSRGLVARLERGHPLRFQLTPRQLVLERRLLNLRLLVRLLRLLQERLNVHALSLHGGKPLNVIRSFL